MEWVRGWMEAWRWMEAWWEAWREWVRGGAGCGGGWRRGGGGRRGGRRGCGSRALGTLETAPGPQPPRPPASPRPPPSPAQSSSTLFLSREGGTLRVAGRRKARCVFTLSGLAVRCSVCLWLELLGAVAVCLAGVLVLVVAAVAPAGTFTAPEHAYAAVMASYVAGQQTTSGPTDATGSTGAARGRRVRAVEAFERVDRVDWVYGHNRLGSHDWLDANCQVDTVWVDLADWDEANATALRIQKDVVFQIPAIEATLGGQGD